MFLKLFYSLFSSSPLIHKYFISFGYKYWRASLSATCGRQAITIFTWSAFKSLSCPITCCAIFLAWYLALLSALNVSIFVSPFFGLFVYLGSVVFSVPPPALLTFVFVFQTPFPVLHGLPLFTFRFGIPFSLPFLSFFFLLLAQVLPQFTARYGHDELMSLCNNFLGGHAFWLEMMVQYKTGFSRFVSFCWCNTWPYKKKQRYAHFYHSKPWIYKYLPLPFFPLKMPL